MFFVKLQDGRSVYSLDSIRLRNQRESSIAPPSNTVELYIKNGILYQINDQGIEQQIGIPTVNTAQRLALDIVGAIDVISLIYANGEYYGTYALNF